MFDNYEVERESPTAEYVLRVFQDWHEQAVAFGDADPELKLTFDTTIAELRDADDLMSWREYAAAMNREWQISVPFETWRSVLQPANIKNLRGVCELIASKAIVPRISEATVFGIHCRPAGAFLAVRRLLADAGANVEHLAPSTRLDEFAKHHYRTFLGPISKLAPGTLPKISVDHPIHDLTLLGIILGCLLMLLSVFITNPELTILAIALLVISWLASWFVGRCLPPQRVRIGNLRTFKDLANVLAAVPHVDTTAA